MKKYIIIGFLICFSTQIIAVNGIFQPKNKQTDTCYLNFKADYNSLYKAIDKINKNYIDNYLSILFLHSYNYDFFSKKQAKQRNFFSSILLKTDTAIRKAKNKDTNYCFHISDIYMMRGIALLYQKNYMAAYQVLDTVISTYPSTKNRINALFWQARITVYTGAYDTANLLLQTIEAELDTTNAEFYKQYHTISADFFIKTYHYEKALNHLSKIEQMPFQRKFLIRTKFIIAQIYNQLGNYKEAISYYEKVTKPWFGVDKLMKSYSIVYKHFCKNLMEEEEQRLLALQKEKLENPEPKEFEPSVVESSNDSSFINMNYPYYFNDEAAMFFLDESLLEEDTMGDYEDDGNYLEDDYHLSNEMLDDLFEDWDSISIHIPKTNFSSMTDTIYLPLIEPNSEYTLPYISSVISHFGWRRYRYHYGVDTKNASGDSIFCIFDGVVRIAKRNKTYGNVVIVRHYNGLETFYAHCSKLLVEPNREVKAGDLIALVGSTGRSSGPHLHFETRYKGVPFNPEYLIDFEKKKLISDTLVITKETFSLRSGNSSSTTTTYPSPSGAVYYKIRSGDTLSTIAKKYKTSITNIKKLNALKSDFIREGQRIRVL